MRALDLEKGPALMVIADAGRFHDAKEWLRRTLEVSNAGEGQNLIIQARLKHFPIQRQRRLASELRDSVTTGSPLILNGDPDIALALGFEGVHLPEREMARFRDAPCWLPFTVAAHSKPAIALAQSIGASAAIVSPVHAPVWKEGRPIGIGKLESFCRPATIPIFALGGITPPGAGACLAAGAKGVAVLSGVMDADDPARAARCYLDEMENFCVRQRKEHD